MKLPPDHHMPAEGAPPPASRMGEKLMQQMGWQKGQGLGKDGTGRKEHIRVKKKDTNEGVGAGASWNWGVKWWEQVFNDQAQALQQKTSPSKPARDSKAGDAQAAEEATSSSSQDTAIHQDIPRKEGAEDRQEFNEDDQVNLYTREVRKAKFEGSRIVFGEDASDTQPTEPAQTQQGEVTERRIKYKKLATCILQQAPKHRMKLKKLEKLVYAQIGQTHGSDTAESCRQQSGLATQVRKSRQFEVADDLVMLVSA
ncbi:hypothetical protein WJX73_004733 [Symbiochloris irregularis]|uniref:G-patch domain-containing protein n=1 Tax=Symbiochloris irregularis TaxID=706552 RepID=A0AAW1NG98_9CHLO